MNKVEICNLALSHIKASSITDFDETSTEARQCRIHYDHCRKMVLEDYSWGFAKANFTLNLIASSGVLEWTYEYHYPSDCVKPRYLTVSRYAADGNEPIPFEDCINSDDEKVIRTNLGEAVLVYTKDVENSEIFTNRFSDALSWKLAEYLALPIGGQSGKRYQDTAMKEYAKSMLIASSNDGNSRQPPQKPLPRAIAARQTRRERNFPDWRSNR